MRVVMAVEIERKFLTLSDDWRGDAVRSRRFRQAYLARGQNASLRVRIVDESSASITIKSSGARLSRQEFEYPVPLADAMALTQLSEGSVLIKTRYDVPLAGLMWEVDVFEGDNTGLTIAEVELAQESQLVICPRGSGVR